MMCYCFVKKETRNNLVNAITGTFKLFYTYIDDLLNIDNICCEKRRCYTVFHFLMFV